MGIPEEIELLDIKLRDLITRYEQYFLGMEKREPLKLHSEVEKLARRYAGASIINTMVKFKYASLVSRFNSYNQYWERIKRLIDEGKYSRERFKMELHERERGEQKTTSAAPPPVSSPSELDQLYQDFIAARRACHLPADNISIDLIRSTIEKNKDLIRSKYQCRDVEFRVVVEDGTPKIKARPKK
ncbi:MAG: hypothetical protein HYS23_08670 [Geobacter sp.]|nr:hypothetical protein [Geobacter sp.]